ncbi:MAG: hypothetical protein LBR17_08430 [Bacteroidales bacterium]|jgi:hypothetical protein|nr:hypothetical protein [Bacteroidales bacterium]
MILGVLTDDMGDLLIENGEIATGDCTADMVERIVVASKGEIKTAPLSGCGIYSIVGGPANAYNSFKVRLIEDLKRNNISYKSINVDINGVKVELE